MTETAGLLGGYRVLDLTDETGHLCGKILGDFGADVIKIEQPGGDPARNRGPFHGNLPDPERSLSWFAYNTSKRSITLNLDLPDGREIFKRLVATADFVVESFPPGTLEGLGLGYRELEAIKPDVILTSITPFGQSGPYSRYRATDLVATAMGGLARIQGDLGRPPVRMSCDPQACCQGGIHGALGSIVAHVHRVRTGEGQHVDVSMQQALVLSLFITVEVAELMGINVVGTGPFFVVPRPPPLGPLLIRYIFPCKDGHVVLLFAGGSFAGAVQSSQALVDWALEEGMAREFANVDLARWDSSQMTQEENDHYLDLIGEFLRTKTKEELYEESVKRGIMMAPCATTADIVRNRQLEARDFWTKVEHPELGATLTYPGAPMKLGEGHYAIRRPPPRIGEHNRDVYEQELGLSRERLSILKAHGVI